MGVTGLWDLLSPAARRVSIESLRGKVVAVDTSIWLIQFIKSMHDENGNLVRGAHLIGFFRRICKLLYYGIRPVFVFDGKPPALKLKTISRRREVYEKQTARLKRITERILLNKLKLRVINRVRAKKKAVSKTSKVDIPCDILKESDGNTVKVDSYVVYDKSDTLECPEILLNDAESLGSLFSSNLFESHDGTFTNIFHKAENRSISRVIPIEISQALLGRRRLDELDVDISRLDGVLKMPKNFSESPYAEVFRDDKFGHIDVKEYPLQENPNSKQFISLPLSSHLNPEVFSHLPPNVQYSALLEIRDAWFNETRNLALQAKNNPELLSLIQIEAFLRHVYTVKEINLAKKRMADEVHSSLLSASGMEQSLTPSCSTNDNSTNIGLDVLKQPEVFSPSRNVALQLNTEKSFLELDPSGKVPPLVVEHEEVPHKSFKCKRHMKSEERYSRILQQQLGASEFNDLPPLNMVSNLLSGDSKKRDDWDLLKSNPSVVWEMVRNLSKENSVNGIMSGTSPTSIKNDREVVQDFSLPLLDGIEADLFQDNSITPQFKKTLSSEMFNENKGEEIVKSSEKIQPELKKGIPMFFQKRIQLVKKKQDNSYSSINQHCLSKAVIDASDSDLAFGDWGVWETAQSLLDTDVTQNECALTDNVNSKIEPETSNEQKETLYREFGDLYKDNPNMLHQDSFKSSSPHQFNQPTPPHSISPLEKKLVNAIESNFLPEEKTKGLLNNVKEENRIQILTDTDNHSDFNLNVESSLNRERTEHQDDRFNHIQSCLSPQYEIPKTKEKSPINVEHPSIEARVTQLERETQVLHSDLLSYKRNTEEITPVMLEDIKELISFFGIPYVLAPAEAEAQCATLNKMGLCDGVISEDSDSLVFGARIVYRNFFDPRGSIEAYDMGTIEKELNLTKNDLILLAMLLGCDYTVGVSGIGIVNAVEVIRVFRSLESLHDLHHWATNVELISNSGVVVGDTSERKKYKEIHKNYRHQWVFPEVFPDHEVWNAFISPYVDNSPEPFTWSTVHVEGVEDILIQNTQLSKDAIFETLQPVLNEMKKRKSCMLRQTKIEDFFHSIESGEHVAKFRSKRLLRLFPTCHNISENAKQNNSNLSEENHQSFECCSLNNDLSDSLEMSSKKLRKSFSKGKVKESNAQGKNAGYRPAPATAQHAWERLSLIINNNNMAP